MMDYYGYPVLALSLSLSLFTTLYYYWISARHSSCVALRCILSTLARYVTLSISIHLKASAFARSPLCFFFKQVFCITIGAASTSFLV
ncbi:hypothetical protein PMIN01_13168 [Paraphaeosphaeria minitans]|uniref:Uncharacterized protein n=1 Tax=Paraphaeosphaeria minitans TaxID=565426 RepID=A0A9P6G5B9_9PLEO|nr:hypothetical protein PMIN01_13168 [Paraphaeosphaeria minitans]